jgi:hypothetical protein
MVHPFVHGSIIINIKRERHYPCGVNLESPIEDGK